MIRMNAAALLVSAIVAYCQIATVSASPSASYAAVCFENSSEKFFYRTKKNEPTVPIFHSCSWLKQRLRKDDICTDNEASWVDEHGVATGPARDVCRVTCDTCYLMHPSSSPSLPPSVSSRPTKETEFTENPSEVPTPLTSSAPSRASGSVCSEDSDEKFFLRTKKNDPSTPIFQTCAWLKERKWIKIICKNNIASWVDDSGKTTGPAREVCKVTCRRCYENHPSVAPSFPPAVSSRPTKEPIFKSPTEVPTMSSTKPSPVNHVPSKAPKSSCTEDSNDKFFFRKKQDDRTTPIFQTCSWLGQRARKDDICNDNTASWVDGSGVTTGPAREVCKITCDTCL